MMGAPTAKLSVTQRHLLKDMTLQQSMVVPAGRLMFCRGRKILGYGNLSDLESPKRLELMGVNVVCVSRADFNDVKAWIG